MKTISLFFALSIVSWVANAQLIISGIMPNPIGGDSSFEYVQIIATQNIDFSSTPYCVVFVNNGSATTDGWVAGGTHTYGFDITSGNVVAGDVFYVGGSGRTIAGEGTTDISSETWLAYKDIANVDGDGFGTHNNGVLGNGGNNADGVAIFEGNAASLSSSTFPIDALFYGDAVGNAMPNSGGYVMPDNDHYTTAAGTFGNGSNTFLFADPGSGIFLQFVGTYNTSSNSWTEIRTLEADTLTSGSPVSTIDTRITLDTNTGIEETNVNEFSILVQNDQLVLDNKLSVNGSWSIFNLRGQEVMSGVANPGINEILISQFNGGIYIFSFMSNSSYLTRKIYIR